jgi:Tfp pilus assembly protein FimT
MFCRNASNEAGFSLLEIVTAIAVGLTLSALAFPQIGRYWQIYELDSAVQVLSSNLEVARYTAISKRLNVVVRMNVAASSYEIFEDANSNATRDTSEFLLGSHALPRQVQFNGSGLLGPPSNPSGSVGDPITFSKDMLILNPEGKLNGGTGSIYLQNTAGDASALSYNMASRLKIYHWNKTSQTWK